VDDDPHESADVNQNGNVGAWHDRLESRLLLTHENATRNNSSAPEEPKSGLPPQIAARLSPFHKDLVNVTPWDRR
jgi:hypothetical protein